MTLRLELEVKLRVREFKLYYYVISVLVTFIMNVAEYNIHHFNELEFLT